MSEKEKSRFVEMADRDKVRFEAEMKHYVPPPGGKVKGSRKKKDPNAPKRALSAFFWFCNDERPGIREANPSLTVGDVAKELGRRWGDVDEAAKKRYVAMAEKDKERYARVSFPNILGSRCYFPCNIVCAYYSAKLFQQFHVLYFFFNNALIIKSPLSYIIAVCFFILKHLQSFAVIFNVNIVAICDPSSSVVIN